LRLPQGGADLDFNVCATPAFSRIEATTHDEVLDSRETLTPFGRVLRGVENGVDGHEISGVLVENSVGEAAQERPAVGLMNDRVHLGIATDALNASIDTAQEIFAQARPPGLIPVVGISYVLLGLRS
jgi:hypothetical protein